MMIRDMFADDINRKINGVIKVDQAADDVIEQELNEYVITRELKKHFITFFNYYGDAFDQPTVNSSSEATVWEMSVRDFSIDSSSGVDADKRGTFLGVAQHGTTLNGKGDIKTGIDYLIENKINCVQIMPMYDFGSIR